MGSGSSFGLAFGPLERAQNVRFNNVFENIVLWKKLCVLWSYGFREIFEQPSAFFLPRPEVGSGWDCRPGLLLASSLLTDSLIHSVMLKHLKFLSDHYVQISLSFRINYNFQKQTATGFGVNWDSRGPDLVTWLRLVKIQIRRIDPFPSCCPVPLLFDPGSNIWVTW